MRRNVGTYARYLDRDSTSHEWATMIGPVPADRVFGGAVRERMDHVGVLADLVAMQARLRREPATWHPASLDLAWRSTGVGEHPWPAPGEVPALQRRIGRRPAPGELPALQRQIDERLTRV